MTTIDMTDKYRSEYTQVCVLKGHIRMLKVGMKHSRLSKTKIMSLAREATGANFGPRAYDEAIAALEARKQALLTYIEQGS